MSDRTYARIRVLWCAVVLALTAGVLAGCVKVDYLELCVVSGRSLGLTEARLDRGAVVAFRVVPIDDDGKVNEEREVSIYSGNPSILGTAPLDYDTTICKGSEEDSRWYFVIYGVERGHTTLYIQADSYQLAIPVTVE